MRLEADLTRTLRTERLRLHRDDRRARSAAALRVARRSEQAQVARTKAARRFGAHPVYWVLFVIAAAALLLR